MTFKRGDMVYFINQNEYETEGYILEKAEAGNQYKIKIRNENNYAFVNEDKITQIFPDYWESLEEHLKINENKTWLNRFDD